MRARCDFSERRAVGHDVAEALALPSSSDARFGVADINETKFGDGFGIHAF